MSLLLNRAKVPTATTGTGTVTLGAGTAPLQSWASAGAQNGATYPYMIEDGTAWELGYGVYTAAGTTLSRNLTASSTGALLNLSGAATVACIARQEDQSKDSATVVATEGTAAARYVNLATVGPVVTLLTGAAVIVNMSSNISKSAGGAGNTGYMAVEVSGATTIAANDNNGQRAAYYVSSVGFSICLSRQFKLTGLTPGVNTFTIKYGSDGGGTWTWGIRDLTVENCL